MTPNAFLADSVLGRLVFEAVEEIVSSFGVVEVHATKSQIAFKRRRGFAYVWLPGMYLARPQAEVVLSIALDRKVASRRFKEIAHSSSGIWQHHLEVGAVADLGPLRLRRGAGSSVDTATVHDIPGAASAGSSRHRSRTWRT